MYDRPRATRRDRPTSGSKLGSKYPSCTGQDRKTTPEKPNQTPGENSLPCGYNEFQFELSFTFIDKICREKFRYPLKTRRTNQLISVTSSLNTRKERQPVRHFQEHKNLYENESRARGVSGDSAGSPKYSLFEPKLD